MNVEITSSGLYLPQAGLWLDPHRKKPTAFLSHAHSDHARARHDEILCTAATADALRIRLGEVNAVRLEFGEPFDFHGCRLTLYPAGHVLGSAQLLVEHAGHRLVYTGDFKLRGSLTCRPGVVVAADTLVIEATYGLPIFRFPPPEESRREIVRFARSALAESKTPVFLGYSFGRGPEIIKILDEANVGTAVDERIYKFLEVYAAAGIEFRHPILLGRAGREGRAAVIPDQRRRKRSLQDIPNPVVAYVSGWAVLDRILDRTGADACICLSDHADWPDLLEYVSRSKPTRVLVTHGYCDALAGYLKRKGFDAHAVHFPDTDGGE